MKKVWLIVGIVLIASGAAGLYFKGVSWKTKEKMVELGPLKIEREEKEVFEIPAWASGVAIGAGVVLTLGALVKK